MTEVQHAERAHSRLGPSSSSKWIACSASIEAENEYYRLNPDHDGNSAASDEGTMAHELGDMMLTDVQYEPHEYSAEMLRIVARYVDYCLDTGSEDPNSIRATEERVRMPLIHEEAYGTGDYSVYVPSTKTLHTIDLKYGQGVFVEVEENSQLMMYAEGSREKLLADHGIEPEHYEMHVYQPRMDNIKSWKITARRLEEFVVFAHKRAARTYTNSDEYTPGDKQCRWCDARPICKEYKEFCIRIAERIADEMFEDLDGASELLKNGIMSDEEVGATLKYWGNVIRMGEELKKYATARAMSGNSVKGFKLVAGKNSYSPDVEALEFMFEDDIWKPKSIRSKTDLEKTIGKKRFADTNAINFYKVIPGSPTLALESDKRAEWSAEKFDDLYED